MRQWIDRFRQWRRARRAARVTYAYALERAGRGAEYLDDVDPGWYERIDPRTLELACGRSCVLGQLHGDFRVGLMRAHLLDLSSAPRASLSPVSFGFQCVQDVLREVVDRDYRLLNDAWRAVIRARQEHDRPSSRRPARRPRRRSPSARAHPVA